MKELKQLYRWFMEEWSAAMLFGGILALVFQDLKMLGFFLAGVSVKRYLDGKTL